MPKFENKMEIDAPVAKAWEKIMDPQTWPKWFPGIDTVTNVTSMNAGGTFEWTGDGRTGKGTISKVEPLKRLVILTQVDKDKDSHEFKFQAGGGFLGLSSNDCRVEYVLDTLSGGGILGNFVAGGNPKDAMRVNKAMHLFRKLVEGKKK